LSSARRTSIVPGGLDVAELVSGSFIALSFRTIRPGEEGGDLPVMRWC
jgi:hypothetical protein